MKKTFLPLTALALLALVSCGGGNQPASSEAPASSEPEATSIVPASSEEPVVSSEEPIVSSEEPVVSSEEPSASSEEPISYSVEITNKEELTAEWHLLEDDRSINLSISPRANISQLIADGVIVIASSDNNVVEPMGRQLHAAGEGTATITVTYGDASDSIEITVTGSKVAADFVAKTLDEVMAYEDLVEDGSNKYGHEAFITKVVVAEIGNKKDGSAAADKYGNIWVVDPSKENPTQDDYVQVYGSGAQAAALVYDNGLNAFKYSNKQDYLTNEETAAIAKGDVLDVIAIRADYKTTPEISIVIRAINGKLISNRSAKSGEVGGFEFNNNEKKFLYTVTGTITGWKNETTLDGTQYGNFYLTSEESEAVYVYGATADASALTLKDDGALNFKNPKDFLTNEATKDLKIGDTVTLMGFRCDYNGVVELNGIIIPTEAPIEPATEPEHVSASIADLLAKTAAENDKLYEVSGIWEKGKGDDYGNAWLTNPETGDSITVYGSTTTATAITFDGSSGQPVYSFSNPKDAKSTLADLHDGMFVKMTVLNAYYAAQNLPEIKGIVTEMSESTNLYAAEALEAENGTVELSKTADIAYGETITVVPTPAEGYKLDKVIVMNAQGDKKDITTDLSFAATCVNKVSATFVEDEEPQPQIEKPVIAEFGLGEDGEAKHADGSSITEYSEVYGEGDNAITLTLENLSKVYGGARDETGKSCLKLGTSSTAGSFEITLPEGVTEVGFDVAGYKANKAMISLNGAEAVEVETLSNNGEYTELRALPVEGKVTFATAQGGLRAMLNGIRFYGEPINNDPVLAESFTLGEDGATGHVDGSAVEVYEESGTGSSFSLALTSCVKVYSGAKDETGKACLKLGTGSATASFVLTVPSNVVKVGFEVAGYKANKGVFTLNGGDAIETTTASNDGLYQEVFAEADDEGKITFATTEAGRRLMINTINFYAIPNA